MIRWILEKRDRLMEKVRSFQKEGASLVSVVIGTMFLLALGVTILTVATRYVTSIIVDKYSTDNFYNAEGALAEVRSGLVERAADRAKGVYVEVLENYNSQKGNDIRSIFSEKYLTEVAYVLSEKTIYTEDIDGDGKRDYVIADHLGEKLDCKTDICDTLKGFCSDPSRVNVLPSTDSVYFVFNKDASIGYTLTLKNIRLEFTETSGYKTTLDTDIVFTVPDYNFEGDDTLDQLKDYIVVDDASLAVSGTGVSGKTTFTGNIYTGSSDSGIHVDFQSNADFVSPKIISRGSLDLYTGSTVNMNSGGDYWLRNIRLKKAGDSESTLTTNLNLKGNSYISNDLDIQSNNATVTLGGKYYGYSYNQENNSADGETRDADYSSAILINGYNTTLEANSLDRMILAGRAFVEQYKPNSGATGVEQLTKSDIRMGESVSVKSNQIAYLVPDRYLTVDHNPVLTSEYDASTTVKTALLLAQNNLGKYLDESKPVLENYRQEGYVYLFLNFKNEKMMNQYFLEFYSGYHLVPDKFISAAADGMNPIPRDKYNAATALKQTDLMDSTSGLGEYLDPANPVIANDTINDKYVYLFLNFASEDKMKLYAENFLDGGAAAETSVTKDEWKENLKDRLYTRGQEYLTSTDLTSKNFSANLFLIAGNIVYNYEATNGIAGVQASNYYEGLTPIADLLQDGKKLGQNYLGNCLTLLPKLPEDRKAESGSIRLISSDYSSRALVRDVVLVKDELNSLPTSATAMAKTVTLSYKDEISGTTVNKTTNLIAARGNHKIGMDSTCDIKVDNGLVIVHGDVEVVGDFTGLILATGNVSVKGSYNLKADMVLVGGIIEQIKSDPDLANFKKLFRALIGNSTQNYSEIEKCIFYQNWNKNAE